jgi:hypothetical protein
MPLGQLDRAVARMGGRRLCDLAAANRDRRGLAATGFQEMRPASTLDDASKGDGITAINRADSASVKRCSSSVPCGMAKV